MPVAKVTIEAPAKSSSPTETTQRLSRRDELEQSKNVAAAAAAKRKPFAKSETVTGEPGYTLSGAGRSLANSSSTMPRQQQQMNRSFDQSTASQAQRRDLSLASSITTSTTTTRGFSRIRSQDNKSLDRMSSSSSRRSVIVKLRDKFLGRRSKANRFDEHLILKSMRVIDLRNSNKLTLEEAIKVGVVFGDDRVRDTLTGADYSLGEAIARGLLKFYHPINKFEFKYSLSCYVFNNEWLLLVNYVLDPLNRRKIGLKNAFLNLIIDKENNLFYTKKGRDFYSRFCVSM